MSFLFPKRISKKQTITQKIKNFIPITIKFLVAFNIPLLPRRILYPILKKMSDINYNILEEKYKVKSGKQKYNFFVDSKLIKEKFKFTDQKYYDSKRKIENSLRYIVKNNSEYINITNNKEEKNIQVIGRMQ